MKAVIFVLTVAAAFALANSASLTQGKYMEATRICNSNPKTAVDQREFREKAIKGERIEYTPQIGAYSLCLAKQVGSMTDDNQVDESKLRAIIKRFTDDEAKINNTVDDCMQKKATPEETAYHLYDCTAEFMKAAIKERKAANSL